MPALPRRLLLLALSTALVALALPGRSAADPLPIARTGSCEYDIAVRLDPEKKQLEGRETITWRNPSGDAVPDLWFHLYLNAFRNTKSTFFKESGGRLRNDRSTDKWGWTEITSLKVAGGGPDLTSAIRFEHPDDDNGDDRTVARVELPQPIEPGGSVTIEVTFKAQLPEVYARSGYKGDFFLVGQWFPKLGVYEPAGRRGRATSGWNCHQYHANSEFYADFGQYRVRITLPSRFVVGATGLRVGREEAGGGLVVHTFEQADVHDFAWTASPRYLVVTDTFSAGKDVSDAEYRTTAALVGRSLDEVRLSDVAITLLLQPEHQPQAARYIRAAKAGLKWYGLLVRPLSVPDADGRGSALRGQRRRRDGVPHLHHGGHVVGGQLLARRRRPRRGDGDGPRVRAPVLVWDGREQRVRGGMAGRGDQHLLDRPRHGRRVRTGGLVRLVPGGGVERRGRAAGEHDPQPEGRHHEARLGRTRATTRSTPTRSPRPCCARCRGCSAARRWPA